MSSASLLETVADHEKDLMAQVARGEQEAAKVIEEAQTAAFAALQEMQHELDAEMGEKRRAAAEAREKERAAIEAETIAKIERIRRNISTKTDSVKNEIVSFLLPPAG